jgi:hypothetical protein
MIRRGEIETDYDLQQYILIYCSPGNRGIETGYDLQQYIFGYFTPRIIRRREIIKTDYDLQQEFLFTIHPGNREIETNAICNMMFSNRSRLLLSCNTSVIVKLYDTKSLKLDARCNNDHSVYISKSGFSRDRQIETVFELQQYPSLCLLLERRMIRRCRDGRLKQTTHCNNTFVIYQSRILKPATNCDSVTTLLL